MEVGIIKLALLVGGRGTRLGKLTTSIPKSMVKVDGRPFIAHQLELLKNKGITDIVLCTCHLGEQIEDYVGDGSRFGLNVEYSRDSMTGTGGALYNALPILGDTFWVMYGDSYLDIDFSLILEHFLKYSFNPEYAGLMTVIRSSSYGGGNIIFENNIVTYGNRPLLNDSYIDYGLSIFRKRIFGNNVMHLSLRFGLKKLLEEGSSYKVLGYEIKEMFHEIGSVSGLLETSNYIKDNKRGIV